MPTTDCAGAYGRALADDALGRLSRVAGSGRPMVWMDVEGPYERCPFGQSDRRLDRAVLNGAVVTLDAAGYRVGISSDRGTSPAKDWRAVMG